MRRQKFQAGEKYKQAHLTAPVSIRVRIDARDRIQREAKRLKMPTGTLMALLLEEYAAFLEKPPLKGKEKA